MRTFVLVLALAAAGAGCSKEVKQGGDTSAAQKKKQEQSPPTHAEGTGQRGAGSTTAGESSR